MQWLTPEFTEIKMDAEIGSYQDDAGDPIFVQSTAMPRERGERDGSSDR